MFRSLRSRRQGWPAQPGGRALAGVLATAAATSVGLGYPLPAEAGASAVPAGHAPAASFNPQSVTFVSLSSGWALGMAPCADGRSCLALEHTTDSGRSWSAQPLPAALVAAAGRQSEGQDTPGLLNVRFANPQDGWIYGGLEVPMRQGGQTFTSLAPTLWSTHNGGRTWRHQPLPGLGTQGPVFDLEAGAGMVYLMGADKTNGVTVEASPVARDAWHAANVVGLGDPAGGAQQSGTIVLQGSTGWLVEGNDRGTTGSARLVAGKWVAWVPPCAAVGHSFAVPAAANASDLVAICVMGGFAFPLWAAAPPGAKLGSSWLYFSSDGGANFRAGPQLAPPQGSFYGVLASPTPGTVLVSQGNANGERLVASFDGGQHWAVAYQGDFVYLGFTSPAQGIGLVQAANNPARTSMVMTFDGGRHWSPVTF